MKTMLCFRMDLLQGKKSPAARAIRTIFPCRKDHLLYHLEHRRQCKRRVRCLSLQTFYMTDSCVSFPPSATFFRCGLDTLVAFRTSAYNSTLCSQFSAFG